jgi:hypothetical protein
VTAGDSKNDNLFYSVLSAYQAISDIKVWADLEGDGRERGGGAADKEASNFLTIDQE